MIIGEQIEAVGINWNLEAAMISDENLAPHVKAPGVESERGIEAKRRRRRMLQGQTGPRLISPAN